jgi:hypothetical protein
MINTKKISADQTIGWKRDFIRQQLGKCKREIDKKEFVKSRKKTFIGFSLCPSYSFKRLHRINTILINTRKYGHRNKIKGFYSVKKQILTRNAFNQEAIL